MMREIEAEAVRLPPVCSTAQAGETLSALRQRRKEDIAIDASCVASIGQAMLQVLAAARIDFIGRGLGFTILEPSAAFLATAQASRFDRHLGLTTEQTT